MVIGAMEKNSAGRGRECWARGAVLDGAVRGGLTEKVTFEQRPEEGEGRSGTGPWGRAFQGENSICKSQEGGIGLASLSSGRMPCDWREGTRGEETLCLAGPSPGLTTEEASVRVGSALPSDTCTLRLCGLVRPPLENFPQRPAWPLHASAWEERLMPHRGRAEP